MYIKSLKRKEVYISFLGYYLRHQTVSNTKHNTALNGAKNDNLISYFLITLPHDDMTLNYIYIYVYIYASSDGD